MSSIVRLYETPVSPSIAKPSKRLPHNGARAKRSTTNPKPGAQPFPLPCFNRASPNQIWPKKLSSPSPSDRVLQPPALHCSHNVILHQYLTSSKRSRSSHRSCPHLASRESKPTLYLRLSTIIVELQIVQEVKPKVKELAAP